MVECYVWWQLGIDGNILTTNEFVNQKWQIMSIKESQELIEKAIFVGICELAFICYMVCRIFRQRKNEKTR